MIDKRKDFVDKLEVDPKKFKDKRNIQIARKKGDQGIQPRGTLSVASFILSTWQEKVILRPSDNSQTLGK